MQKFAPLIAVLSPLLLIGGCWDLDLPDTKAPGFTADDAFDVSLEGDSTTAGNEDSDSEDTGSESDTSDTSSVAEAITCPEFPCDDPPLPSCENSSVRRVYLEQGACYEGECIYAWNLESCEPLGCQDGECIEDSCADVVCDLPPDDTCSDATTLITWHSDGHCDTSGVCQYPGDSYHCPLGCEGGACR